MVLLGKRGMDDGWIKNRYTVDTVHIYCRHIHWMYTQYLYVVQAPRISFQIVDSLSSALSRISALYSGFICVTVRYLFE